MSDADVPRSTDETADPVPRDGSPTVSPFAPTSAGPSSLPPTADRYVLGDEIARGGMGAVHRATDTVLQREVAVKLLQERYAPDSAVARRFAEEARITGQLQHPNIPAVHDLGTLPDGRPFLAMKLIKGETLDVLLKTRLADRPEFGRYVAVFEQICQALAYAHAHDVIHRDLKPSNIMVGAFGEVQVMDWGLAKVLTGRPTADTDADAMPGTQIISQRDPDGNTQAGSILGTPAYMPPEQAIGAVDQIDRRSDVFGLGAILAAVLTGRPPFEGQSADAVRLQAATGQLADCLARLDACGADPELVSLCKRCLSPNRDARPWDARAVADEVARLRAAADERARQAELDRVKAEGDKHAAELRTAEQRKRRRLWLGAATALAVAIIAGLGSVLAVQRQANIDLEAKNEELAAEQEKVEQRFDLAMSAIKIFHTGVSEDVLLKNDQFKELRTKLLKEAARFYTELEGLLKDQTDAKSRATLAAAFSELAFLTQLTGDKTQALAVCRKSLEITQRLVDDNPDVTLLHSALATSQNNLGNLLSETGKTDEALHAYRQALEIRMKLADDNPDVREYRSGLADSHHNLGLLLHQTGKMEDALQSQRRAIDIWRKLADDNPDSKEYLSGLSGSYSSLGSLFHATGKVDKALYAYRQALEIQEKLADEDPTISQFRDTLADRHLALATLLAYLGNIDEALQAARNALQIRQKLTDEYPGITQFKSDLAESHYRLGEHLRVTGKPDEALQVCRQARDIWKKLADDYLDIPGYRSGLAKSHISLGTLLRDTGKPDEALQAFRLALDIQQKLADANPAVPLFQSDLAGTHHNIGMFLASRGQSAEALKAFEQACDIQEKAVAASPHVSQFQSYLANHLNAIANLLRDMGKSDDALQAFRKALAIRQKLADDNPAVPELQSHLAGTIHNFGVLLGAKGQSAEALKAFEQAHDIQEKAVAASPHVSQFQAFLANHLDAVANLLSTTGKPDEALHVNRQALDIRQKLADGNPSIAEFQSDLATCCASLGTLLYKSRKQDEAAQAFRQALDILQKLADEHPTISKYRIDLGQIRLKFGRLLVWQKQYQEALPPLDGALKIFKELLVASPGNATLLSKLATGHAECGLARVRIGKTNEAASDLRRALEYWSNFQHFAGSTHFERARTMALLAGLATDATSGVTADEANTFAEQSVAALRDAVKSGRKDVAALQESDFDAVRQREDFGALLKQLQPKPPE